MSRIHVPASSAPVDLSRVNLNLLVALDALLTEASVTKAAARLGLTQSALSHALRQLREVFGDALLIRGRGGMVLTPRAQQLAVPIRRGLLELQRALHDEPLFEPSTAVHRFTLATSDYFASIILPPLLALLRTEAPKVDLDVRPVDERRTPELLESGAVDLVIQAFPTPAPALRQQKLFEEGFSCIVRQDHPEVNRRLELAQYLRLPHVLISPRGEGEGIVDQVLAKQGLSRRIALRLPFFLTAPLVITRSDLVLTAPRRMVEGFAQAWRLQVLKPPLPLPTFNTVQLWHERYEDDPAHRWLRDALMRATAPLR
ncbi:DNA-binding transcriptional regulator, LysR family [Stigmatella aurantiaca]|uniref:DNA-binding transcriptional regulator, LysR family n=1 Tax=Stigmatella aurantiaca TaxID=41 RepID=A0A1H8DVE9_STIAU|nr:LysR family transcriptional regulator [Stigmatella aurantiaca]SEN11155.1 DNA-binding transcriptional regulator, LysR family [Stigmatella aurantiaca]